LSFTVSEKAEGGSQPVRVRQQDGTLSNRATLIIMPVVKYAEQQQEGEIVRSIDPTPARFEPGSQVKLVGGGFAPNAHIQVLDVFVTDSDVQFIDSQNLVFKLVRPTSTPRAPDEGDATGDAGDSRGADRNGLPGSAVHADPDVLGREPDRGGDPAPRRRRPPDSSPACRRAA